MFYSHEILQKRGGRFGVVWIAATSEKRLTRRDFNSVNVYRTSDDIIDYILLRAPARRPGLARPRLSLYLASQLMYGVTKVYSKQNEYLLADVTTMSTRCRMIMGPVGDIDMKLIPRADAVTNLDYAPLSSRYGPAYDPNFGVFNPTSVLELDIIPEMEMWESQISSPELRLSPSLDISAKPGAPEMSPPHTVSSSEITIEEILPLVTAVQQFGQEDDLPILSDAEVAAMMSRVEDSLVGVTSLTHAVSTPIQPDSLTELTKRTQLPPLEETPIVGHTEALPQPTPVRQARAPSPGITPRTASPEPRKRKRKRSSLALDMLELSPTASPSPRRQRHKRRLPFMDRNTQIPRTVVRENLNTSQSTCRPFELPDVGAVPVADLFKRPGRKALRLSPLNRLFTRNTFPTEFRESDSDHPIWTVPDLSVERSSASEEEVMRVVVEEEPVVNVAMVTSHEDLTSHSIEALRQGSSLMEKSHLSESKSLSVITERDLQQSMERRVVEETPLRKRPKVSVGMSSEDEVVSLIEPMEEALADLTLPVLEKPLYSLPEETPLVPGTEHLLRSVADLTTVEEFTTFRELCPPSFTSRQTAAKTFSHILLACGQRKLICHQEVSYGDIYIARGEEF